MLPSDAVNLASDMLVAPAVRLGKTVRYFVRGEGSPVDQDKTVELVTNLDRAAVEDKLRQIVAEAKARGLNDIVTQLGNFAGAGKDDLQKRITPCLKALAQSPQHRALFTQLELVELNLPNLG
jgi:hypothetical protein